MRCFLAIDVSEELKPIIINLQKHIPKDASTIRPESLHFTLKFFRDVDPNMIIDKLSFLNNTEPFIIHLYGVGAFPSENPVKILWIGAESPNLIELQKSVTRVLGDTGDFVPHVTIARTKIHSSQLLTFVEKYRLFDAGKMRAECVKLKKSKLLPSGPVYTDIGKFRLRAE